jgi:preprotein translocase subunit SecG
MILITVIHVIVCFALVLIVLLQAGKGAEMGAAFGGASQTLFGSSGAMGFLTKLTTIAAIVFMITSLLLAFATTRQTSSIMTRPAAKSAPAESGQGPTQPQAPAAPQAPQAPQAPAPEPKK